MARLMEGKSIKEEEIPRHAKGVYEAQSRIGWDHFQKGRISKEWSRLKTTDSGGNGRPDKRWRTGIVRLLRCKMARSPEADFNHGLILEACKGWWRQRREKRLMRTDVHLARE